jgi:hypothetical protein
VNSFKCSVKGVSGLLQNNPASVDFDKIVEQKLAHDSNQKEVLHSLYINADGDICQPATHFERSLQEAAKKLKVKGSGKATYSKLFGSMVSVSPIMIKHNIQEFSVFSTSVVIPSTKGRIVKHRPLIHEWSLSFTIMAEDEIPEEVIYEALKIAGKYCGIGDWRPQKGGKFGKFEVESFTKV